MPLNPDLGSYFGATDGVLVINVPQGSTLGLKGGDVVLNVLCQPERERADGVQGDCDPQRLEPPDPVGEQPDRER